MNYNFRRSIAKTAINIESRTSYPYALEAQELYCSSRKALLLFQKKQMEELLQYSYHHVPYYHEMFKEIGLIEGSNINWKHFKDIPVLTKDIIRKEQTRLISDEAATRKCYTNTSGGSTGEPVSFIQDSEYFHKNFGNKILYGLLNHKYPGDREIKLWGNEKDILGYRTSIKERVINYIYNRVPLNSFVMTKDNMNTYIDKINQFQPVQIWTYADSIYELSKYILEKGVQVYNPQNIVTTAGVLYDEMRICIQKAFPNSYILNQYGSREAGAIGIEVIGTRGMKIFDHAVKLEVQRESDNQISDYGYGKLLVTNLTNYSMPLIRYEIGDTGELTAYDEKEAGSFSTLSRLNGRTNTHIRKRDGSLVHGEYFTHLFYDKKWVENFKVIQHDYEQLEYQIVLNSEYPIDDEEVESIQKDTYAVMGDCVIDIKYVDSIERLKSGKYQFVISEI